MFKKLLIKEHGYIDDYLVFKLLASNIENRVHFKSEKQILTLPRYDIEEILSHDTEDTFSNLMHIFLDKNAISGVQPKTIAIVQDKESMHLKEVIVKTWGNKKQSMMEYFKIVVMNYLLKNGDAHLKNFGLLFSDDFKEIVLAPAYDIVTTTAYIFKDRPALSMDGKKIWQSKGSLLKFGMKNCYLSKQEAVGCYDMCITALKSSIQDLEEYIQKNREFETIGGRMVDCWRLSLEEKDIKEIPVELTRTWK